jgi:hypothetical protein
LAHCAVIVIVCELALSALLGLHVAPGAVVKPVTESFQPLKETTLSAPLIRVGVGGVSDDVERTSHVSLDLLRVALAAFRT